jgi:HAD superfamily hydrolase (TIGR01509 family)
MSSLPAAVLWDMDGTLVDTEPLWMSAQRHLAADYEAAWTDADAHNTVGKAMPVSAAALKVKGVDLTVQEIIARLVADVVTALGTEVPWLPGAKELLTDLRRHHVPCALVTMAYSPVAHRVAAAAPPGAFAAMVAGDDVSRGKPFPDPYLLAAQRLRVTPTSCVAIEDSLNGALSASAAGLPVLIVPGVTAVPAGPGRHFTDLLSEVNIATLSQIACTHRSAR